MPSAKNLSADGIGDPTPLLPPRERAEASQTQAEERLQPDTTTSPRESHYFRSPALSITSVLEINQPPQDFSGLDAKLSDHPSVPDAEYQVHRMPFSWHSASPTGSHSGLSSSGVQSPPGGGWRSAYIPNSGFGKHKVKEGREIEIRRAHTEKSVGRTGKGIVRVPSAMLRALGFKIPADNTEIEHGTSQERRSEGGSLEGDGESRDEVERQPSEDYVEVEETDWAEQAEASQNVSAAAADIGIMENEPIEPSDPQTKPAIPVIPKTGKRKRDIFKWWKRKRGS